MNKDIEKNSKNFNLYVFLSTFSRNLIEVFVGTILYKAGYSLQNVILYYLIVHLSIVFLTKPLIQLSKKTSNRVLSIIGVVAFILLQIQLNKIYVNYYYLILLGFIYGLYRCSYWIARRFYNLKVIQKENIANKYTFISIINQLAVVVSSYVGALLLDFISIKVLTIISMTLFILSVIPLYKLKFEHEHNDIKLDLLKTLKQIGFSNMYLFASYELLNVIKFFFPLYIFIYVKDTYQTIGLVSLLQSIATIIFSYIYGRLANKDKDYLKLAILLSIIVYVFKANTYGIALYVVSFLEGFTTKMSEISVNKNFFQISKKFEYYNYNYAYEIVLNIVRTLVLLICYLFIYDIKTMIYICLFIQLLSFFCEFNCNLKDFQIKE